MKLSSINNFIYIIRLEKGEEFINALTRFCVQKNIKNALFWAIGSVENPTLAHYLVSTKKYTQKTLSGVYEITNLTGNVGLADNKPLVHGHITLSDESMRAFGGHLVNAIISATVELHLLQFETAYEKKLSDEIGLKLYDLPEQLET